MSINHKQLNSKIIAGILKSGKKTEGKSPVVT